MILENLHIGYKNKAIVEQINAELKPNSITALIGVNGAGKSTLIKTILGLINPISGGIKIKNTSLFDKSLKEKAQLISAVLTDKIDNSGFTVYDLVASGRHPYTNLLGKLDKESLNIISETLELLKLDELKNQFINELSDGQKQKCWIARCLVQKTPRIIMDEPTSFLDYPTKLDLFNTLKEISKNQHKSILVSSHDLDLLQDNADHSWLIKNGKLTEYQNNSISLIELLTQQ